MSPQEVFNANTSLLDAAERLAGEFDHVPTGSVLRCFSRAVAMARRSGAPLDSLPVAAEQLARRMLALRLGSPVLVG